MKPHLLGSAYFQKKITRLRQLMYLKPETTHCRDNFYLIADSVYQAVIYANDPDGDSLIYK
jgi:hypothetical protein